MRDEADTEFEAAFSEGADNDLGQPSAEEGRPAVGEGEEDADHGGEDALDPERAAEREPATDPERAAAVEETPDEFAGLSEAELRERAKALAAEVQAERDSRTKAENTIRSNAGRLSRTERELNELRIRMRDKPAEVKERAAASTVTDEDLDRVASEYEDVGRPLVDTIKALRSEVEELKGDRSREAQTRQAAAERELTAYLGQQQAVLTEQHPDYQTIVSSPAYAEWAGQQPQWVKDLIIRNGHELVDGEAAVAVFDRFKADTAPKADPGQGKRERQLEGSRHIPARAPAMQTRHDSGGGSYDDEWKRADEEDKRRATARR